MFRDPGAENPGETAVDGDPPRIILRKVVIPMPRKKGDGVRKHLSADEVERLIKAAGSVGRHGPRDALMILMGFIHGFRVTELVTLRRDQVDLKRGVLHVARLKGGMPSTHPLTRREKVALKKLMKSVTRGPLFVSERGGPLTRSAFAKLIERAGERAGLADLKVHAHMLRHACGYELANQGRDTRTIQDYLGHRNIQHTVEYTKLASGRFDGFFED